MFFCIKPAMIVESIPPERKAPSGTSEIICSRTASSRVARSSSMSFSMRTASHAGSNQAASMVRPRASLRARRQSVRAEA